MSVAGNRNAPGGATPPCPRPRPGGGRCHSRRWPACGLLWAGDTRSRILANVQAYGGDVALVTITAPGADALPWAEDGRWVDPEAAAAWNASAPERWRVLHRVAAQRARRRHGKLTLVAWSWEYQAR